MLSLFYGHLITLALTHSNCVSLLLVDDKHVHEKNTVYKNTGQEQEHNL